MAKSHVATPFRRMVLEGSLLADRTFFFLFVVFLLWKRISCFVSDLCDAEKEGLWLGSRCCGEQNTWRGREEFWEKRAKDTGMNNKMNIPMVERVEASAAECVCHEVMDTVQSGVLYCSNIVKSMRSKRLHTIV